MLMGAVFVRTFYQFASFPDFAARQASLLERCNAHGLKGSILLAHEGINGMLAGSREGLDDVLNHIRSDVRFAELDWKESACEKMPFVRMKVRLKKEIVTLGVPEANPAERVGEYVDAKKWNQLLDDPDVVVVDTRNSYEVALGTFPRAKNPETRSFGQFPAYVEKNLDPKKHEKVALFCTGGIRCEKATAYMLSKGFREVYHLEGGILKYLETIDPGENRWQGECFVFDGRVTVDEKLEQGSYRICPECRQAFPIGSAHSGCR
jgi:UPF0176 protein